MTLSKEIPNGDVLRKMRERIGLSQNELTDALGFVKRGRVIRDWEHGIIKPTPTQWAAMRYLYAAAMLFIDENEGEIPATDRSEITSHIGEILA